MVHPGAATRCGGPLARRGRGIDLRTGPGRPNVIRLLTGGRGGARGRVRAEQPPAAAARA
ncbi:MAG: hypothetical protein AVDCRST_MAG49-108 [uncultured Thermomicrobiales bacterium]|uniref:Uncharacterized protein n=1 Tax=uncultured Thermomicrobiales bacterium TaxID=1645740 RepID=A0A6J4TWK6_9BACT|nr:MAG: hypothetical protein AVDCRST_MAG49-108 [uncultured Thermomicrobiales bacterium]